VHVSTNATKVTNTCRPLYLRISVSLCTDWTHEANEDGGGSSVGLEDSLTLFVYSAIFPYLILTPWSTVLLENLTGLRLVKKFPAF